MIYGLQDFFFLATWWVGYFFTAVQEFFSITFVLHAIFFLRQALAGNFFSKSPTPPPPSRVKWSAPKQHVFVNSMGSCITLYDGQERTRQRQAKKAPLFARLFFARSRSTDYEK